MVHPRLPCGALGPAMADNAGIGLARERSRVPGVSSRCGRHRAHGSHGPRMIDDKLPVYGIPRVTRHPRLCGVSLWAIAHLPINDHFAARFMFGAPLVTAVSGMVSIDRKRAPCARRAQGRFRKADLTPAVRRHSRRPHPASNLPNSMSGSSCLRSRFSRALSGCTASSGRRHSGL